MLAGGHKRPAKTPVFDHLQETLSLVFRQRAHESVQPACQLEKESPAQLATFLQGEYAEQAPVATAVQYMEQAEDAAKNCANCLLFTAGEGGRGKCALFIKGTVAATGHCTSWAEKPPTP